MESILLVVFYWLYFIGCILLVVFYWLYFIGCILLVVFYWLYFIGCIFTDQHNTLMSLVFYDNFAIRGETVIYFLKTSLRQGIWFNHLTFFNVFFNKL